MPQIIKKRTKNDWLFILKVLQINLKNTKKIDTSFNNNFILVSLFKKF